MHPKLTPALLGARLREARLEAGLSQTQLGEKIGASRFWVAEFENGKETVELGLVLRALSAAGVVLLIASDSSADSPAGELEPLDLDSVLEATGFDVRKR